MNDEKKYLTRQFSKYIENVIMPMYPQLSSFDIKEWFPEASGLNFDFHFFYKDYTGSDVDHEIESLIREMMNVFSIDTIVYGVTFKIKE